MLPQLLQGLSARTRLLAQNPALHLPSALFARITLKVNRALLLLDRERGMTLNQLAKAHAISKASVCRVLKEEKELVSRGFENAASPVACNLNNPTELASPIPQA
jgi:DNA-binding MarR family transcriptional regulator